MRSLDEKEITSISGGAGNLISDSLEMGFSVATGIITADLLKQFIKFKDPSTSTIAAVKYYCIVGGGAFAGSMIGNMGFNFVKGFFGGNADSDGAESA